MSEIDFENYKGCIDIPDSRDITAEEIWLLTATTYPESILYANTPILNQGSIGACTIFGLSGATFESTYLDAVENGGVYNQPYDPWWFWWKAKERWASDSNGWSLQGALQLAVDLGIIAWYVRLAAPGQLTVDLLARTLAKKRLIYTGSAKWNWWVIGRTGIYEDGIKSAGHAYCLPWYKPKNGIARNSWTENWGNKWHFDFPEERFGSLYSTYIILDPSDVDKMKDVRNVRAQSYNQKSLEKKIWTGDRPNDIASDSEIRIMLGRAVDVMWARSRQYWATTFEDKILRGKWIVSIWNEKDWKKNATDRELAVMFTRAVKRDPKASEITLTRFQVSAVIGRDFL